MSLKLKSVASKDLPWPISDHKEFLSKPNSVMTTGNMPGNPGQIAMKIFFKIIHRMKLMTVTSL